MTQPQNYLRQQGDRLQEQGKFIDILRPPEGSIVTLLHNGGSNTSNVMESQRLSKKLGR